MKNNRTFLEKLLDGAEIEWKPLKEVAEYIRGVTYNKGRKIPMMPSIKESVPNRI